MNIITGKKPIEHKYGQGFSWHNTEDGISNWSASLDLIPKPYVFSDEYIKKYGHPIKNSL